jgi:OST-HTH/LOTUS domain
VERPAHLPAPREGAVTGAPRDGRGQRSRPAPLDIAQAMPLVERALQVLERRGVQPQLGLLKSTMLQLDSTFSERAYGAGSFSDFVEKLKKSDYVNVSGTGGRYIIERKGTAVPEIAAAKPEELLPQLRDMLETHRIEMEDGVMADQLYGWMKDENPDFDIQRYGFQEFTEFLNFAQDKLVVRIEPDEEKGVMVFLGAEFYPPAPPQQEETVIVNEYDEKQPIVAGQPSLIDPTPPPVEPPKPPKRPRTPRKRAASPSSQDRQPRPRRAPARKRTPPSEQ